MNFMIPIDKIENHKIRNILNEVELEASFKYNIKSYSRNRK